MLAVVKDGFAAADLRSAVLGLRPRILDNGSARRAEGFALAAFLLGGRKVGHMLRIHSVIVELITQVAPVATAIGRRDSSLEKQLRAALSSAALNVSEGSDQRGKRRSLHYSIALGSARESWSALVVAAAWGYVPAPDASMKARFDQVIGTLHRVVHPR